MLLFETESSSMKTLGRSVLSNGIIKYSVPVFNFFTLAMQTEVSISELIL